MHLRHGVRVYTEHVLTHSRAQNCRLDGLFESGRTCFFDESRRRPVVSWYAGGGADSRFISARGSTVGRCGRVVATRRPVFGGTWCVPESSRTSGLSAGSGDLRDRRLTADTCLVLLRGVGSPWSARRAAICVRSSAGGEGWLSVVGLSPVPFSWVYFCIRSGLLFYRGSCMLNGLHYILCCCVFVL